MPDFGSVIQNVNESNILTFTQHKKISKQKEAQFRLYFLFLKTQLYKIESATEYLQHCQYKK